MFAAYASMARIAAARHDTGNHLGHALETSREIGVSMGVLMANGSLTIEQAFDDFHIASQHPNRKLRDLAADVATANKCRQSHTNGLTSRGPVS